MRLLEGVFFFNWTKSRKICTVSAKKFFGYILTAYILRRIYPSASIYPYCPMIIFTFLLFFFYILLIENWDLAFCKLNVSRIWEITSEG